MKFDINSILKLVTLAPVVVAGIEQLHGEKDSTTKQQMAQDALTLATGVADVVLPTQQTTTDTVSSSVSSIINSVVSVFNATGIFQHKTASTSTTN